MTAATTPTSAPEGSELVPELQAVRQAAEVALETRAADGDVSEAQQRLTTAAKAALDAGHGLNEVAAAEAAGQAAARDRLRKDVLRRVERSARRLREVTAEHETLIAQADALALARARSRREQASLTARSPRSSGGTRSGPPADEWSPPRPVRIRRRCRRRAARRETAATWTGTAPRLSQRRRSTLELPGFGAVWRRAVKGRTPQGVRGQHVFVMPECRADLSQLGA